MTHISHDDFTLYLICSFYFCVIINLFLQVTRTLKTVVLFTFDGHLSRRSFYEDELPRGIVVFVHNMCIICK